MENGRTGVKEEVRADSSLGTSVLTYSTASIVANVANLVVLAVLARLLRLSDMGVVVSIGLILAFGLTFTDLGMSSGVLRLVAENASEEDSQTRVASVAILLKSATSIVFAALLFVSSPVISTVLTGTSGYQSVFELSAPTVLLNCMSVTLAHVYLGLQRTRRWSALQVASSVVGAGVSIWAAITGLGAASLLLGYMTRDGLVVLFSLADLRNMGVIDRGCLRNALRPVARRIFSISGVLVFASIAGLATTWFDRAYLLTVFSLDASAVYGVAASLFSAIQLIPSAIGPPLFSSFSRSGRDSASLQKGIESSVRVVALLVVLVMLVGSSFSSAIITVIAGAGYSESIVPLRILMICGTALALAISTTGIPVVSGASSRQAVLITLSGVMGIALSILLTPIMSPAVMSVIRSSTIVFSAVGLFGIAKSRIKFNPQLRFLATVFLIGMVDMLLVDLLMVVLPDGIPWTLCIGGIAVAVYVSLLRIAAVVKEDDIRAVESAFGFRYRSVLALIRRLLVRG